MFAWFVRGPGGCDTGVQTRPDRTGSTSPPPREQTSPRNLLLPPDSPVLVASQVWGICVVLVWRETVNGSLPKGHMQCGCANFGADLCHLM